MEEIDKPAKSNKNEIIRMLKFLGFSISAGVIQIVSFEILYDLIHWIWWPSYLVSIILSVIWNFTFNRKFTFKSANNVSVAMALVILYYCAFIPLSVFGGDALENIGWNGTLVTFIMMVLNFVTEFIWQRFVVFRNSLDSNEKKQVEQPQEKAEMELPKPIFEEKATNVAPVVSVQSYLPEEAAKRTTYVKPKEPAKKWKNGKVNYDALREWGVKELRKDDDKQALGSIDQAALDEYKQDAERKIQEIIHYQEITGKINNKK